jgi:hypothetical protein
LVNKRRKLYYITYNYKKVLTKSGQELAADLAKVDPSKSFKKHNRTEFWTLVKLWDL